VGSSGRRFDYCHFRRRFRSLRSWGGEQRSQPFV